MTELLCYKVQTQISCSGRQHIVQGMFLRPRNIAYKKRKAKMSFRDLVACVPILNLCLRATFKAFSFTTLRLNINTQKYEKCGTIICLFGSRTGCYVRPILPTRINFPPIPLKWLFFFSVVLQSPWALASDFQFYGHFTEGRTPWMSDQLVVRPLPKHSTTQTQNKQMHIPNIHTLCEIRTHDPGFRASEDSTCLWPLGYRDRLKVIIRA
jgi:hypothetical protein